MTLTDTNPFRNSYPWRREPFLTVLAGLSDLKTAFDLRSSSVVSNWRVRFPEFPEPTVSRPPLFNVVELVRWLHPLGPGGKGADSMGRRPAAEITAEGWYRLVLKAFHGQAKVPSSRATACALVVLHHLAADLDVAGTRAMWFGFIDDVVGVTPRDAMRALTEMARAIERERPHLRGTLVRAFEIADTDSRSALLDVADALDRVARSEEPFGRKARLRLNAVLDEHGESRGRDAKSTVASLSLITAATRGNLEVRSILDPACGEGSLLVAGSRRWPSAALYGQELDPDVRSIAAAVLEVRGMPADLGRSAANSLTDDQHSPLRADFVMIDPPCGEGDPPLEWWIELGLRHLAERGSLTVLLPAHQLVNVPSARRRPEKRLHELVRGLAVNHSITTAIVMPRNLRTDVVGPLVLLHIGPPSGDGSAQSGIRLISIATRHLTDFEQVARSVSRRLVHSIDGQVGSTQWFTTDDLVAEAVGETFVEPLNLLEELERAVDRVERVSSRPGAPRKSSRPIEMEVNELKRDAVSYMAALPSRLEPISDPLVEAARELLRVLDASTDLMPQTLQERLRARMQRLRSLID